ncbi:thioesterase II family protein [Pseudoalteromonas luteoviolacea]|uniref:Thioesterase domain-containing protein n=1 Tax=Pseudoalteromonas luteoviolacea H33 TaxID=1365251 RepID=A0A166ZQQ8_9GAMM|nr:alpha/beta fold hydrolase [Pseudoalteromonas luteoviolacea]KZN44561.1 hypothetical protein N476_06060 [Pseudoalteromonas luteoviolacea H33]KZN75363.1 hypothetical protein N477_19070 [Pseudoalteromonas luteoviolacea H33-S]MBQ4879582.1 thioesterase [Pseudoalteromonas luteoviolacea]MBQ4908715.1 thioesterase [Pseudoalteromonas luteoviolacea]
MTLQINTKAEHADAYWLRANTKTKNVKLRLICFPYAGGGARMFLPWQTELGESIEVLAYKLAGRESRLRAALYADWSTLLDELIDAIGMLDQDYGECPYVIFGHSFGARIAFELTRKLEALQKPLPLQLFLSACRAPSEPCILPYMYNLDSSAFYARVAKMGGTPAHILEDKRLMRMLEPILRSDMALSELWPDSERTPVNVKITALSGVHDKIDPPLVMQAWQNYTHNNFELICFEGEHFFLHSHQNQLLRQIENECKQLME